MTGVLQWMGYGLFGRDRHDRQGGGVMLHIKEWLACTMLAVRHEMIESFWVMTSRKANKAARVVGVYCI